MKKIISIIIAVCLLSGALPIDVLAQQLMELNINGENISVSVDSQLSVSVNAVGNLFDYYVDDTGNAIITGYSGDTAILNIPEVLNGYPVAIIGNRAFKNKQNLVTLVLPDSITSIESYAFAGCPKLENVKLSGNVEHIDGCAFENCDSLTKIEIPKSLSWVNSVGAGQGPFSGCDNLREVTFEQGITKIPGYLFGYCPGIETVEIPDTVTEIGRSAFTYCKNLSRVTMPDSVTTVASYAFAGCPKLENVKLSGNVEHIDGCAFENCDNLTKIEIPKSLSWVDSVGAGEGPFSGCDNLREVTFEQGITKIPGYLFGYCPGIETVEIPDTVTQIGWRAFNYCKNLSRVTMPDSITSIESYAFAGCPKLENIKLPGNVEHIDGCAFENCDSLTKIEIPKSLSWVDSVGAGEGPFSDCDNLREVTFEQGITKIPGYLFGYCPGIETVEIPDTVTEIGRSAFTYCKNLSSITIPDSVTSINEYVFDGCGLLSDVKLGTGITEIPYRVFNNCSSLTKIVLPHGIVTVKRQAFTNCANLLEVTIPRATSDISADAFSYPTQMTFYGIAGTYAETYANKVGAKFVGQEVKATDIKLSDTELRLKKGGTVNLTMVVTPRDFTDKVIWDCSDKEVAAVTDTGLVTAKGTGTAYIYVTVGDCTASCKITVYQPVTGMELNETSLSLERGEHYTLTASVYPSDASDKRIEWSTSDAAVATVDGKGLVTAVSKGKAVITAMMMEGSGISCSCTITVNAVTEAVDEKFADVPKGAWYVSAIQYAYDNGIMTGKSDTAFEPESNLTRAEFATVLHSQAGKPVVGYRPIFLDVAVGQWYTSPVLWAFDSEIVSGYESGEFGAMDPIQREQLALMMYKYAKLKGYDTSYAAEAAAQFGDCEEISGWALKAIQWAASHGIMSGKGSGPDGKALLDPKGKATRAECAAMMRKMLTMG